MFLTACGGGSSVPETASSVAETTTSAGTTTTETSTLTAVTTAAATEYGVFTTTTEAVPLTDLSDPARVEQLFSAALDGIAVEVREDSIIETGTVHGTQYSLTLDLQNWAHFTTLHQMTELSRLFWQCYPNMYARFGDISDPPVDVILTIENDGYEVAAAWENHIHLHDQWLWQYTEDYDCITHELAHIIQNGWNSDFLEYSDYIERFADCCRYEYAMDGGRYNDSVWTLQTIADESTRESSVRFLVWLDTCYSDADSDVLHRFAEVCRSMRYLPEEWDAAWTEIFTGTALEGMTIDEVWARFAGSDFAYLSSYAEAGETSELLAAYPVRERLNNETA